MADGGDRGTSGGSNNNGTGAAPVPSKWWYVGHLFFWVITGLVVYILYKDTNKEAARKHLIVSLVLGIVACVVVFVVLLLWEVAVCGGDLECYGNIEDW